MLTVRYDGQTGITVADEAVPGIVEYWVTLYKADELDQITVGNEVLVNQFRLMVLEDQISHTDIQFAYQDSIIAVNMYGNLIDWPPGMCAALSNQLHRLILGASAKRKRLKEQRGETVIEVAPPIVSAHG